MRYAGAGGSGGSQDPAINMVRVAHRVVWNFSSVGKWDYDTAMLAMDATVPLEYGNLKIETRRRQNDLGTHCGWLVPMLEKYHRNRMRGLKTICERALQLKVNWR